MAPDSSIDDWVSRRELTTGLASLLLVWYVVQLSVLQRYGAETAVWWFYFSPGDVGPGFALTPGIVLSPLSHDMADTTHLISNVAALVIVGSLVEPYTERRTYVIVLLGAGFLGILFSNVLAAFFQTQWSLAGASAGLLSLHAYISIRKRRLLIEVTPFRSKATAEWIVVATGLMLIPIVPIYEIATSGNIGHALGPVLGSLAYVAHSRSSPHRIE